MDSLNPELTERLVVDLPEGTSDAIEQWRMVNEEPEDFVREAVVMRLALERERVQKAFEPRIPPSDPTNLERRKPYW